MSIFNIRYIFNLKIKINVVCKTHHNKRINLQKPLEDNKSNWETHKTQSKNDCAKVEYVKNLKLKYESDDDI